MKKVLVVGCGSIGRRHMNGFKKAGIDDIAGADVRQDRLDQAQKEIGVQVVYKDYQVALKSEKFDAVVIATAPHLHTEIALAAAEHNCHLFIEKPLAISMNDISKLRTICEQKKLVCFVAYCYRFIPSVIKMKEMLDQKRIGDVLAARLEFSSYLPDWHPWEDYRTFYMAKGDQGGGALFDESHGLDLLRWLLGDVKSVYAIIDHISDLEITSDDIASLILRFKSGTVVQAHFDLLGRAPRVQLEIIGSEGTILWDRIDHKISVYDPKQKEWDVYPYTVDDLMTMYPREVEHFISCVSENKQPLIDLEDGQKTLELLLAAIESSKAASAINIL